MTQQTTFYCINKKEKLEYLNKIVKNLLVKQRNSKGTQLPKIKLPPPQSWERKEAAHEFSEHNREKEHYI